MTRSNVRRRPAARHTGSNRRSAARFVGEQLEPRLALAVAAVADNYATDEDIGFATDATAVVPRRSQGGWSVFDDIPLTGPNATRYPDAGEAGPRWFARGYDATRPTYGAWEGAGTAGLSAPFAFDVIAALAPATPIDARSDVTNTVLARRSFELSGAAAAATELILDYVCDDGCVVYLNEVEVLRANLPAGPIDPTTLALSSVDESAYASVTLDLASLGVVLHPDDSNVLAIETHNRGIASSDIGFDVSLSIPGGQGGARANDTTAAAVGPVNTYYWDGIADPATTTVTTGPALAADRVTVVGSVTIDPATGEFRYDPATAGLGVGYSGNATFQYVLRDNDIAAAPSTATVTIAIRAVNDPPVAADDVYAVVRGAGPLVVGAAAGATYISPGSAWFYTQELSDQDDINPAWRGPPSAGFNPASGTAAGWSTTMGGAPLGFGNGNEVTTLTPGTPAPVTYYFQRTFNVPGPLPSLLRLGLMADDCAAVYINGVEVTRSPTLPYGQGFVTFCSRSVSGLAEQRFVESAIPTAELNLQSTGNTIAVELHQVTQTSNDLAFDLWLRSGVGGLLVNDADPDDPAAELRVEVVDASQFTPAVGTLAVQADGSLTFTPAGPNVVGTFSFTYRTLDNGQPTPPVQASRHATATITVLPTPHDRPPGAIDDVYRINEDTVLDVTRPQALIGFGDEWSYFDDMQNGQQASPNVPAESYPLDSAAEADATPGVADAWYGEAFNTASSDPTIGAWKTGRGIFAAPIRGLLYGPGTTLLGGVGDAVQPAGQNTVDTYLFRRTFTIDDAARVGQLLLDTLIDDGAVIYINGTRVGGIRMPADPITSITPANAGGVEDRYEGYILINASNLLHNGTNTIAVEVHQGARTSSDAGFDLSLSIAPGPGVLVNDVDPDGDMLSGARLVREPANGTVVLNADGTFRYTPNLNFNGVDAFDYVVSSNGRESGPATVVVVVDSVDAPPDAVDDNYSTPNNETLVVAAAGVLANDFAEGELVVRVDLSGGAVIGHAAGRFTWTNVTGNQSDGSFTFEPTPGYVGSFVLQYTVQDEMNRLATALVSIEVTPGTAAEDLDADGDVDFADLARLVGNLGLTMAAAGDGDINGDGRVGAADAVLLRNALSAAGPSPSLSAAAVVRAARIPQPGEVDAVLSRSKGSEPLFALPRRYRTRTGDSMLSASHARSTVPLSTPTPAADVDDALAATRASRATAARRRRG